MFAEHQENELVESELDNEKEAGIDCLTHSVSVNEKGEVFITLSNASLERSFDIECNIKNYDTLSIKSAEILTAGKEAYNSFDNKENVIVKPFSDYENKNGKLIVKMPPVSVIAIKID
jgi:alpha-N-arabinofuranosidase